MYPSCNAYQDATKNECPNCGYTLTEVEVHTKMKLKEHIGFKRLESLITTAAFVITYIVLVVNERGVSGEEAKML